LNPWTRLTNRLGDFVAGRLPLAVVFSNPSASECGGGGSGGGGGMAAYTRRLPLSDSEQLRSSRLQAPAANNSGVTNSFRSANARKVYKGCHGDCGARSSCGMHFYREQCSKLCCITLRFPSVFADPWAQAVIFRCCVAYSPLGLICWFLQYTGLRLRGGGTSVADKIVRTLSVEQLNTMVVSKKNRMKETLNDYMRGLAIDNPEMRDLEAIFSGIQASFLWFLSGKHRS
jgi:hypothetical protein